MKKLLFPRFHWKNLKRTIGYTFRPYSNPEPAKDNKWAVLISIFIWGEVLSILAVILKYALIENGIMDDLPNVLEKGTEGWSKYRLILTAGVIFPIVEELAFRLSLKSVNPLKFSISFALMTYYLVNTFVYHVRNHNTEDYFIERLIITSTGFLGSYFLSSRPKIFSEIANIFSNKFKWVYWSTIVIFALFHLYNYQLTTWNLLFIPVIILAQLISASIFGYVRMHYGILIGIVMHMIGNSYLMLIFE